MITNRFANFKGHPDEVSRIGFGLGLGGHFQRREDASKFAESLELSIELGNNHIDSAQNYGDGQSEEIIRKVVRRMSVPLLIATKIGPSDFGEGQVIPAIEKSLRRLDVDSIPLLYLHWPNPSIPLEITLAQIEKAFEQGKIQGFGLSNFSISEIQTTRQWLRHDILQAIQVEYNLFDRSSELDIFPYADSIGISVVAYSPLDQGRIVGRTSTRMRIESLARMQGISPGQLALAWLLQKSPGFLIPSTSRKSRVRENYGALKVQMPQSVLDEIEEITKPNIVSLLPRDIEVGLDITMRRGVYVDLKSAKENLSEYSPSPEELAAALRKGEKMKPVRVVTQTSTARPYLLVEGRIRFWAHVIAFGFTTPLQALVRD